MLDDEWGSEAEGGGRPPIEEDWGRFFCCSSKEFSEFYPSCLSSFIGG